MQVLVTGGTGFIASYAVKKLVESNNDVVTYDLNPNTDLLVDVLDKIKIVRGDITDYQLLEKTIQDNQITHIVHTAYYFTFASQKDPLTACKVSNLGTSNIFEIARKNNLKRVVWASSNAVFGHAKLYDKQPVTEEAPLWPMTVYGACKLFNEHMGQHYFDQFGLSNIGLRFSGVYGYGMARRKTSASNFLFDLFETGSLGKKCVVKYPNLLMNWQYVKDAAEVICLSLNVKNHDHVVFNTGGYTHRVQDAVKIISNLIPDLEFDFIDEEISGANIEEELPEISLSRANNELNYYPKYTLEKGVHEYINKLRKIAGLPLV